LRWMGLLVESEPLDERRFRDVFEDHGHRIELEAEVGRCDSPRLLEVRLRADAFAATSTQRLEESGRGTRLTTVVETEYTKRLARLAGPFVTRRAQQQLEADHAALKALIEAG
jgi:beta-phosphoglucomutase-like phosphatase (HAD superfamily)